MDAVNSATADLSATAQPVVRRYVRHFLGRSPAAIDVKQTDGMLVIRLDDVLTDAEQRLCQSDPSPAGQDMVEQVFRKLVRQSKNALAGALAAVTARTIRSVFCDVDCATGEAVILLSFDEIN